VTSDENALSQTYHFGCNLIHFGILSSKPKTSEARSTFPKGAFGGSEAQPKGMKESPLMTVGLAMAFVAVLGLYFWVTRGGNCL
jgi:hypothetical protein